MERHCSACGARISDDMKICGNCGKIIPPHQKVRQDVHNVFNQNINIQNDNKLSPQRKAAKSNNKSKAIPKTNIQKNIPKKQFEKNNVKESDFFEMKRNVPNQSKKQKTITIKNNRNIKKYIKIALIVLIIYIAISLVQIFRVKHTGYEFKSTDMKMSQDNFGQAIDVFFENGHWTYNPFTLTVKYSGETTDGKEYNLKFSAVATVKIKEITVDGKEKTDSQMESVLMGMFI